MANSIVAAKKRTSTTSSGTKSSATKSSTANTTASTAPATTANASSGTSVGANTNYQALINAAVAKGDYVSAAQYEQQRNDKINAMNAAGTNTAGYGTTSNYAGWLDTTDYSTIAKQQMAQGASAADVQETYNNRYNKAANTIGLQQYADDELMQAMLDYINSAQNTELPEFDEEYWMENQPTLSDSYAGISEELFNKILSREDFSYDPSNDPLYGYYQDMYRREGDRAMQNTLAEVASGAGGMNSWAVTAAQQAQNNYNAQLGDKIPELYQLAYQMYLNDKASMVEDLGLANQMSDKQYNRYMDQMNLWRNDRDFSYGMYRDNMGDYQWGTNFNYGVNQDLINNAWKDKEWDYGVATDQYNREQAEIETAWNRAMDLFAAGTKPTEDMLRKAGIAPEQADQILDEVKASKAKAPPPDDGGDDGDDYEYVKQMPTEYDSGYDSVYALGLGPITLDSVAEMRKAGAIVDNGNGGYKWADGWDAERWKAQTQKTSYAIGVVDLYNDTVAKAIEEINKKNSGK